jgi:hypothetical protein
MEYAKGLTFWTSEVMRWIILEGGEKLEKTIENIAIFANLILEHVEFLEQAEEPRPPAGEALALCREIADRLEVIALS